MIRERRTAASRGLGRRITGSCGGREGAAHREADAIRAIAWNGPKAGRMYGYPLRREIDEK